MSELSPFITAVDAVWYLLCVELAGHNGRFREAIMAESPYRRRHLWQEIGLPNQAAPLTDFRSKWARGSQRLFNAHVEGKIKLLSEGEPVPEGIFSGGDVGLAQGNWLMISNRGVRRKFDPKIGAWAGITLRRDKFLAWIKKESRPPSEPIAKQAPNSLYGASDEALMPEITRLMKEKGMARLTAAGEVAHLAQGSKIGDSTARRLGRKHKIWSARG